MPDTKPHWGEKPDAIRYDGLSFDQILADNLQVMDAQAIHHCMEHGIPIIVFNFQRVGNIERAIAGERIGTRVIPTPDE